MINFFSYRGAHILFFILLLTGLNFFEIKSSFAQINEKKEEEKEEVLSFNGVFQNYHQNGYDEYGHLIESENFTTTKENHFLTNSRNSTCFYVNTLVTDFLGGQESLKLLQQIIPQFSTFKKTKKEAKTIQDNPASLKSWVDFLSAKVKKSFLLRSISEIKGIHHHKLYDKFTGEPNIYSKDGKKILLFGQFESNKDERGPSLSIVNTETGEVEQKLDLISSNPAIDKSLARYLSLEEAFFFDDDQKILTKLKLNSKSIIQVWHHHSKPLQEAFHFPDDLINGMEILSIAKNGKMIALLKDRKSPVQIYDLSNGELKETLPLTLNKISKISGYSNMTKLSLSPNGNFLAIISENYPFNHQIDVWDINNKKIIDSVTLEKSKHFPLISSSAKIEFSPTSNYLYHHAENYPFYFWQLPNLKFHGQLGQLKIGENYSTITFPTYSQNLDSFKNSFDPQLYKKLIDQKFDQYVLGHNSNQNQIDLIDVKNLKVLKSFKGHEESISRYGFTPDLKNIISTSFDGTIRFWNIESGLQVLNKKCSHVLFLNGVVSPNSLQLVSGLQKLSRFTYDSQKQSCCYVEDNTTDAPIQFWHLNYFGDLPLTKKTSSSFCVIQ
jgi:WD40 repeat protein